MVSNEVEFLLQSTCGHLFYVFIHFVKHVNKQVKGHNVMKLAKLID